MKTAPIRIKQTGLPPSGNHWSYGPEHMRRISRASAAKICGMYPLPNVGYETVVGIAPDAYGGRKRLYVQNVGGDFYLASVDAKVAEWPEVFNVEIIGE